MTPYQRHVSEWRDCTACDLCERRQRVVLFRGRVPCDVLFAGEAPGKSEDALGRPFVGPAGKLLDQIIERAWLQAGHKGQHPDNDDDAWLPHPASYGLTNLVCCIPLNEDGEKTSDPPAASIKACAPRLRQIVTLCKPRLIVSVGKLSEKWLPKSLSEEQAAIPSVTIPHPASILRADISQRGLAVQRCVVTVADALEELSDA